MKVCAQIGREASFASFRCVAGSSQPLTAAFAYKRFTEIVSGTGCIRRATAQNSISRVLAPNRIGLTSEATGYREFLPRIG